MREKEIALRAEGLDGPAKEKLQGKVADLALDAAELRTQMAGHVQSLRYEKSEVKKHVAENAPHAEGYEIFRNGRPHVELWLRDQVPTGEDGRLEGAAIDLVFKGPETLDRKKQVSEVSVPLDLNVTRVVDEHAQLMDFGLGGTTYAGNQPRRWEREILQEINDAMTGMALGAILHEDTAMGRRKSGFQNKSSRQDLEVREVAEQLALRHVLSSEAAFVGRTLKDAGGGRSRPPKIVGVEGKLEARDGKVIGGSVVQQVAATVKVTVPQLDAQAGKVVAKELDIPLDLERDLSGSPDREANRILQRITVMRSAILEAFDSELRGNGPSEPLVRAGGSVSDSWINHLPRRTLEAHVREVVSGFSIY